MRNGYITAIAPTGSTSNIANTTAGIDPVFKKFLWKKRRVALHQKQHQT